MNIEQIVKETVAKIVAEKELTAAEEKKREEIVKAMKKDFKGPAPAMYAIATDKAKKLAEGDVTPDQIQKKYNEMFGKNPNTKFADVAKALGTTEQEVMMVLFTPTTFSGARLFEDGDINEDYEVAMAQDSLDSIIRAAMMLKAQMGDQEVNLPAWIQDHITNSENYINQAAKGYHESDAQMDDKAGAEEMDEANLGHNEISSIQQDGPHWVVNYGTKEKVFNSEEEARTFYDEFNKEPKMDEAKESNEDKIEKYKKYTYTLDGKIVKPEITFLNNILKAMLDNKIYNVGMPKDGKVELTPESGKQGTYTESTELDENTMTTNEGRSAEDLKQAQLEKAYDHLEKMKSNTKLFSKEDIKKAEDRIEKLETELDALAAKATNESLDEVTVRRWQHYAGIK
jgi:polyhydroxyalkanoate synthesis regulator phasin